MNDVSETAYHPGDDMEQFELEMHERHNNFFKDAKDTGIKTWCEKSRFSASKEVKRVRNGLPFFLFDKPSLLSLSSRILLLMFVQFLSQPLHNTQTLA